LDGLGDKDWRCPDCGVAMRGHPLDPEMQCAPCATSRAARGDLEGFVVTGSREGRKIRQSRKRTQRYLQTERPCEPVPVRDAQLGLFGQGGDDG